MAGFSIVFFLLLTLTPLSIFHIPQIHAEADSAPAPSPSGTINIFAILEKTSQFTVFIRLLNETGQGNQINTQVNSSTEGMTVFAPTDNAFSNLKSGALNDLSDKAHIRLIQYHILPKFYTQESLVTVSNPVRTQASGQDGHQFGLNFTGQASQLNVSTGLVSTQVYNALRKDTPLAVYQVDKVLMPIDFTLPPAPETSPPAPSTVKGKKEGGAASNDSTAKEPSADTKPNGSGKKEGGAASNDSTAKEPSADTKPNGSGKMTSGLGFISAVLVICMAMLS